jgi:hypothetical protein
MTRTVPTVSRCVVLSVLLLGALFVGSTGAAGAQDTSPVASPAAVPVLPPGATVGGLGLAEWEGQYLQWMISAVVGPANTVTDATGDLCALGQHGPVFFLEVALAPVTRRCTVPSDVVLFVPSLINGCASSQPDPELPADPSTADDATLMACAKTHVDVGLSRDLANTSLVVDGVPVDVTPYRAATGVVPTLFVPGNPLGIDPGVARSASEGYAVLLGPLAVGEHVIAISWAYAPGGVPVAITYNLTVAAPI